MTQGSPPRMKIAGLFSGESPMSLALTTTHENCYFQRSIVSCRATHRRDEIGNIRQNRDRRKCKRLSGKANMQSTSRAHTISVSAFVLAAVLGAPTVCLATQSVHPSHEVRTERYFQSIRQNYNQ